jgi:hypothetical protein
MMNTRSPRQLDYIHTVRPVEPHVRRSKDGILGGNGGCEIYEIKAKEFERETD